MVSIFVTILCFIHLVSFFIHFPLPRKNNRNHWTQDLIKEYPQRVTIAGTVPMPSESTRGFFFFGKLDGGGRFLMNLYSLDVNYYYMIANLWAKDERLRALTRESCLGSTDM